MIGGHRFYFVGKAPLVFYVVVTLLFINTVLGLLPESSARHIRSADIARIIRWQSDHLIAIQFALLAAGGVVLIIYRKHVEYVPPRARQK